MRRRCILAAPFLLLGLTACASQAEGAGTPAATASVTQTATAEQLYVELLTERGVPLTEREMTAIGPRICTGFDTGLSYGSVERGVLAGEPQLSQDQAGWTIGGAVGAYCRHHAVKITG